MLSIILTIISDKINENRFCVHKVYIFAINVLELKINNKQELTAINQLHLLLLLSLHQCKSFNRHEKKHSSSSFFYERLH